MELKVHARIILGKKVKQLRAQGLIPAELFGHGIQNKHLSVPIKEFAKTYKEAGENTVITLVDEKGEKFPVLISDVIRDYLSGDIRAIDFHHIRKGEKIQAKVPIEFIGEAPATKKGLILVKVLSEVEVEALPEKVPHRFEVDLSELKEVGQSIAIHDLKIDKEIKLFTSSDTIIATITELAKEEEVPPAPTPEAAATQEDSQTQEEKN